MTTATELAREALQEAYAQIDYLHGKFTVTGSGATIQAKIAQALAALDAATTEAQANTSASSGQLCQHPWFQVVAVETVHGTEGRCELCNLQLWSKDRPFRPITTPIETKEAQAEQDAIAVAKTMIGLGYESGHMVSQEATDDMLKQFNAKVTDADILAEMEKRWYPPRDAGNSLLQRVYPDQVVAAFRALLAASLAQQPAIERTRRFRNVSCSQCGRCFGPGDHGFSHCENHSHLVSNNRPEEA